MSYKNGRLGFIGDKVSEFQDWKKKFEEVSALLQEKEQTLKEYQKTIQHSNELIREVMDKLSFELKMAHQIHRILLPVDLPVIDNCEFSFKFQPADAEEGQGKDFYEVFPHSASKSFSIIMSSCSSHSLSALMFSARLKMMSRGERVDHLKPHEFVSRLIEEINLDISSFSESGMRMPNPLKEKVALFYALISQKTYEMFYCLVGDITALVQYAETGVVEALRTSAASLGEKSALKTNVVSLNGRDRLVLCSPGVLHCQAPGGDNYSLSALKKSLQNESTVSVHEVRNRILYELDSFAQGRPSERDQSVLVMEVKSRILKLTKSE